MNQNGDNAHDEPIAQMLKVVELLDCVAGRADDSTKGEPIAIITMGHRKEVETPLMLRLRDSKSLVIKLLIVLATHGDAVAQNIMENQFVEHLPKLPVAAPTHARKQPTAGAYPSEGTVLIGFQDPSIRPIRMSVLGGYRSRRSTMIVFRAGNLGSAPVIAVGRLVKKTMVRFRGLRKCETLTSLERRQFFSIDGGQHFRIRKKIWQKLTTDELLSVVQARRMTCID